jgi:hypothetical protein
LNVKEDEPKPIAGRRIETTPPEPLVGMALPAELTATVPPIWMAVEVDVVVGERFTAI